MMVQSIAQIEKAAKVGFHCVQPVASFLLDLRDNAAAKLAPFIKDRSVPCEVSAVPLPVDVRVTERGFNIYAWLEDLKKTLEFLSKLGCEKLVWSDGRARLLPLEGDRSGAKEQALQFLYVLCEAASERGMTVLVEPLGSRRTNFLNSLDEIRSILPLVGKENLAAAISLRELAPIGLSAEALVSYGSLIQHVHFENPSPLERTRISPRAGDGYEYRPFLRALRGTDYSGVICLPEDADEPALRYCQQLWEEESLTERR
jgi:sugar phosphate isomerase/epimerase